MKESPGFGRILLLVVALLTVAWFGDWTDDYCDSTLAHRSSAFRSANGHVDSPSGGSSSDHIIAAFARSMALSARKPQTTGMSTNSLSSNGMSTNGLLAAFNRGSENLGIYSGGTLTDDDEADQRSKNEFGKGFSSELGRRSAPLSWQSSRRGRGN